MTQERPANAVSRPVSASQAPEVPVERSTLRDDWRAALAAQLAEQFSYAAQYATVVLDWDEEADELMPTVRRIVAAELRAAIAGVQAVYDLQCPVMPPDRYVGGGAYSAHTWWQTVLGGKLRDLRERFAALDATPDHGKA